MLHGRTDGIRGDPGGGDQDTGGDRRGKTGRTDPLARSHGGIQSGVYPAAYPLLFPLRQGIIAVLL